MTAGAGAPLELWGGVECTVVRIGDEYRNQVVETGHSSRITTSTRWRGWASKRSATRSSGETVAPKADRT